MTSGTGISVIIPAYEAASCIGKAIASVRLAVAFAAGTEWPVTAEVVVVDDASSDATAVLAEAFGTPDCPVRVVRHATNQGAGAARNTGADAAAHGILCFLDSDDVYLAPHLAAVAAAFAQRPEIDFVSTRFQTSRPIHPSWIPGVSAASSLTLGIRKAAHQRLGGFPPFRFYEDVVYRRLADRFLTGWYIENETVVYMWRPGNSFDRQLAAFEQPMTASGSGPAEGPPAHVWEEFKRRVERLSGEHLPPP
ncbi:glycosyltransferase family 2 protein [Azospirillum sp.]|uniref:glycosyltransferase family 2 protein n=1 Tax=Azospirillum sp. TaxID=34012 RepID=UPI003D7627D3